MRRLFARFILVVVFVSQGLVGSESGHQGGTEGARRSEAAVSQVCFATGNYQYTDSPWGAGPSGEILSPVGYSCDGKERFTLSKEGFEVFEGNSSKAKKIFKFPDNVQANGSAQWRVASCQGKTVFYRGKDILIAGETSTLKKIPSQLDQRFEGLNNQVSLAVQSYGPLDDARIVAIDKIRRNFSSRTGTDGNTDRYLAVAVDPNREDVLAVHGDGTISRNNLKTGKTTYSEKSLGLSLAAAISDKTGTTATLDGNGSIHVRDTQGNPVAQWKALPVERPKKDSKPDTSIQMNFSPKGNRIALVRWGRLTYGIAY